MSRARQIADFGDGIATADIDDGAVTAAKINSAVGLGITQADIFKLTVSKSLADTTNEDITANLERADDSTSGLIGSGMSESSGIFTFPETGIYLVTSTLYFVKENDGVRLVRSKVLVSTDSGSNYDTVAEGQSGVTSHSTTNSNAGDTYTSCLIDVTNASTFRVKFQSLAVNSGVTLDGNSGQNKTHFSFIRLGDT